MAKRIDSHVEDGMMSLSINPIPWNEHGTLFQNQESERQDPCKDVHSESLANTSGIHKTFLNFDCSRIPFRREQI